MRIEAYFQVIRQVIETHPIVQSFSVRFDKRGTYEGFIVVASSAPDLDAVLKEIEPLIELST